MQKGRTDAFVCLYSFEVFVQLFGAGGYWKSNQREKEYYYAKVKVTEHYFYYRHGVRDGICHGMLQHRARQRMSNENFLIAFHEIPIMWPIACILEYFVVEKLSTKLAFRIVTPQDKPIFITLAISSMIVCLMCPTMSFIATLLFMNPGKEIIALWLQKWAQNFPMALCWQIFFAGPGVRNFFRLFDR